jgi:hypothetical protein
MVALGRGPGRWLIWMGLLLLLHTGCGLWSGPDNGEPVPEEVATVIPSPTPAPPEIVGTLTADPLPPQLHLTNLGAEAVTAEQPAQLRLELAGTAVTSLTLEIRQQAEDGNFQPVSRQPLLATLPGDGIHQWPLAWYGEGLVNEEGEMAAADAPFVIVDGAEPPPHRPLPPGPYRLAVLAQNEAGTAESYVDLSLAVLEEPQDGRLYLDPQHSFQFLMPHAWHTPVYSGTLLLSHHLTTTGQMQLIPYPELPPGTSPTALADRVLAGFGPVSRLYQDRLPLAETQARRVAYGYTRTDGADRLGVLLALVHGGQGYVLDIEGDAADEAYLWRMAELAASSWQFVVPVDDPPPYWARQPVAGWSLAFPRDYNYQELRGWHRFSQNRDTFWAVRLEEGLTADTTELMRRLQDAAAGVTDFGANPAYYFELGPQRWLRADFRYTNSRQEEIQGAILLGTVGQQPVIVWLEAPLDEYEQLEQVHFLLMLMELARSA